MFPFAETSNVVGKKGSKKCDQSKAYQLDVT